MNTNAYYSPLSERRFSLYLFGVVFVLFAAISLSPADLDPAFVAFLLIFGVAASTLFTIIMAPTIYNEIYRPILRWWYSKRVDRDPEMAPPPRVLEVGARVLARRDGDLHEGTYRGVAPDGSYSVRLDDGRHACVTEVYLKVE